MECYVIRGGIPGKYIYSSRACPSGDYNAHIHRYYEFLFVRDGSPHCIVEGTGYDLSPGDMVVTSPNELHSISFAQPQQYERAFFQISEEYLSSVFGDIFSVISSRAPGTDNVIPARFCSRCGIAEIFSETDEYIQNGDTVSEKIIFANAVRLVAKVSQILKTEKPHAAQRVNQSIKSIERFVRENICEPINLNAIAEHMFLDKSYMCRLFKSETGITLKAYVNMQRIIHAKNMLLDGGSSTRIYASCGFNDYSTFYRSFIKYAGMTPESFKKNYC